MSVDDTQVKRRSGKESPDTAAQHQAGGALKSSRTAKTPVSSFVRHSPKYAFAATVLLSFVTRYWQIWDPAQVVFDEVHFGKFASYYLRREYYFDVHPPLAKMLIALGGWLVGYDGHFLFEKIGMDYVSNGVPYIMLRGWVALFGFALPPLVYMIMAESGYSVAASFLAALLVTFDNALVTQGRLILLDNIMIFFMLAAVYSYIKFFKLRYKAFGVQWWTWLLSTGAMLGCVVSCKLVGLFTITLIGIGVLYDLWRIIDIRRGTTMTEFYKHFVARAVGLIVVPFMLYLGFFAVHFAVLTHTGPGDAYHTAKFQKQLIDNPLTKSSFDVHYGDAIAFKHRQTGVFLYSDESRYPLRYEDQRVSSQGQQVTGAKEVSDNTYWIFKPTRDGEEFAEFFAKRQSGAEIPAEEMAKWAVRNNDVVQMQHIQTNKVLRTHDVASPLTPTNMEFTCILQNDTAAVDDTLWQVKVEDADEDDVVQTTSSFLRIVSQKHKVAMWTHSKKLPEWGRKHQEINGNKKDQEKTNLWVVSEIRGRKPSEQEKTEMLAQIEPMGFVAKYVELQSLMIKHNNALTSVHPFQSTPISWPLLLRGISFWTNNEGRKQIYLLGNPVGWWASDAALFAYVLSMVMIALCERRNIDVIDGVVQRHMFRSTGFLALAWFVHYFPFFLMGRSLFLHHYLPASIFAYMVLAACYQFFMFPEYQRFTLRRWNDKARALIPSAGAGIVLAVISVVQVAVFLFFAPVSYGNAGLTPEQINARRWLSGYDLHFQK
ncbi:PMT-domain-containing protein [Linderina pennispora]|uniref:Dolichyl-phosphate-mannose--protein mannosyltransferase n=1 Tax=Linderina pennispora TaxID=61395 RepID=A0A1Y1W7E7_9FUNG|nr:PMT-domain-containing protein [Linderina pennispora]ORX69467.1 PMT-domain-containing protein [Linderina pennispora]